MKSTTTQTRNIQWVSDTKSNDHRHAIVELAPNVDFRATKPKGINFRTPASPNKKLAHARLRIIRSPVVMF